MKRLAFFLFFLLIPILLLCQTKDFTNGIYPTNSQAKSAKEKREFDKQQKALNWNFKIDDGKVYWQRVFNFPTEDTAKVTLFFNDERLFGRIGDQYYTQAIFASYNNLDSMQEPMIFQSTAEVYFYVQIKDNRYRVTIVDIIWKGNVGTSGMFHITQEATLTMQDFIDYNIYADSPFKARICKQTNICLLNIFDYNSEYHISADAVLDDDF